MLLALLVSFPLGVLAALRPRSLLDRLVVGLSLMSDPTAPFELKTDPAGGYFCPDAVKHVVTSPEEAQARYNEGCGMRATASTNMNSESSRSHAVVLSMSRSRSRSAPRSRTSRKPRRRTARST